MARWLSWLERRPVTAEVTGSSPVWVVYSEILYSLQVTRGILAQLGEHLPYKQRVTGSSPVGPIFRIYAERLVYADMAQLAEQLICNQQVIGSSPIVGSYGWIPEWPKGADCKSVAERFGGSNPPPSTS